MPTAPARASRRRSSAACTPTSTASAPTSTPSCTPTSPTPRRSPCLRRPIPALTDEQVRFLGREVAIIDYAPSGTGFLAKNVQKKVTSGDNAFIIANHGIVALGTDPDRAVFNMALLEKVSHRLPARAHHRVGQGLHDPHRHPRDRLHQAAQADEKRIAAQITKSVPRPGAGCRAARRALTRRPAPSVAAREAFAVAEPVAAAEAPGAESARLGYAISELPRRRRHHAPAQGPGRPAGARPAPRRAARRARATSSTKCQAQQGAHRPGQVAHPRRRAAQPGLQLPVPARRSTAPTARTSPTATATSTSTSSRPAARRCSAATTRRSTTQVAGGRARRRAR